MINRKKPFSIIWQVAILFVLATLLVGSITYFSQHAYFNKYIKDQTAGRAASITKEVDLAVKQYPAYEWLLKYWYEHADELDVEYDTDYRASTETEQKCWLMEIHQPNLQLRYANTSEIEALPEEDQKLYAEILYSWLITRLNEIKRSHQVDFLFTVISEEPYDKQCFLMSAADPGAKRGTNYEEVYPIGTEADVITEYTQEAMRECVESHAGYLADANKYMDYYAYLGEFDGHQVMTGVTYDLSAIKTSVVFYNFGSVGKNSVDNAVSAYDYDQEIVAYTRFLDNESAVTVSDTRAAFFDGDASEHFPAFPGQIRI